MKSPQGWRTLGVTGDSGWYILVAWTHPRHAGRKSRAPPTLSFPDRRFGRQTGVPCSRTATTATTASRDTGTPGRGRPRQPVKPGGARDAQNGAEHDLRRLNQPPVPAAKRRIAAAASVATTSSTGKGGGSTMPSVLPRPPPPPPHGRWATATPGTETGAGQKPELQHQDDPERDADEPASQRVPPASGHRQLRAIAATRGSTTAWSAKWVRNVIFGCQIMIAEFVLARSRQRNG